MKQSNKKKTNFVINRFSIYQFCINEKKKKSCLDSIWIDKIRFDCFCTKYNNSHNINLYKNLSLYSFKSRLFMVSLCLLLFDCTFYFFFLLQDGIFILKLCYKKLYLKLNELEFRMQCLLLLNNDIHLPFHVCEKLRYCSSFVARH